MADVQKKLISCMLLLAIAGTTSGAGYGAAEQGGISSTGNLAAYSSSHGDSGLTRVIMETGGSQGIHHGCHFPIWNLPAYYICIMACKIGGGGDSCAPSCEAKLSICT
jgi:hypothetical protein